METEPVKESNLNQCPGCGAVDKNVMSKYCLKHIREMRDRWYSRDEGIIHLEHQEAFRIMETNRGAESRELRAEYRMVERLWNRLLGPAPRGGR